jgi:hypothetical protein
MARHLSSGDRTGNRNKWSKQLNIQSFGVRGGPFSWIAFCWLLWFYFWCTALMVIGKVVFRLLGYY